MADKRAGLDKFYAARAASSLKRDQQAGYHWGYLTGDGKTFCTCGFILDTNDDETFLAMAYPEVDLKVGAIVQVQGHRKLPSRKGIATALIVNLKVVNNGSAYIAGAFCQKCSAAIQDVPIKEADEFVALHETTCGVPGN